MAPTTLAISRATDGFSAYIAAPAAAVPQIRIRHLWKSYGEKVVLENLTLDVQAGEFVALVG